MDSLNHENQADVIEAFSSTSRYLNAIWNIDNPYCEGMVTHPHELQWNKVKTTDTETPPQIPKLPFLVLHLSIANGFVSSKVYGKRYYFAFEIVNYPFLDGDVPCRATYGVYIVATY